MYQIRQLGNFLFSVRQVPSLIGDQAAIDGWFFLGSYVGAAIAVSLGGGVLALPYIL